ncbi:MAG: hypothetical protein IPM29_18025 [Planctomycetes bacterium]|nr:hypothetical protein [Planctomycetota bacterium]
MRALLATALVPLLAGALPAQSGEPRHLVDPVPFEWAITRQSTGFPVGYAERRVLRYQQIHDGLAGRPRALRGIAWRRAPGDSGLVGTFAATLEMRFSTSPRTAATISSTFTDNVGADESIVTANRSISFPDSVGPWLGPAPFDYVVPTDAPWSFAGNGPLCVELQLRDHTNRTPAQFALHAAGYPVVASFGAGCGGITQSTQLGLGEAIHRIGGLPAGAPAILMLGLDFRESAAGTLPIDLGPFGAPDCSLQLAPLLDVRGLADPTGTFEARIPIATIPAGVWYGAQGASVQPGINPLGLVTTDATVVLPLTGRTVGRVWAESLGALTGVRQPVYGLVLQLRE